MLFALNCSLVNIFVEKAHPMGSGTCSPQPLLHVTFGRHLKDTSAVWGTQNAHLPGWNFPSVGISAGRESFTPSWESDHTRSLIWVHNHTVQCFGSF